MKDRAISLNAVIDALHQSINLFEAEDRIRDLPTVAIPHDVDLISRQDAIEFFKDDVYVVNELKNMATVAIPSAEPKTGHCKDCRYFEYDSMAKVDGIPLIVAHEICKRWGDGCKTKEDGYCFMFEPQKSEDKE